MAAINAQVVTRSGLAPSYAAASAGGDYFQNSGSEVLHVKNGSGSSVTVTIITQATVDGMAVTDRTVAVPAGADRMIGPFPAGTYNDGDGRVQITYSATTSVTVGVIKIG